MDWYTDVFDIVFPDLNAQEVNNRWKKLLKEKKHKKRGKDKEKDREDEEESDSDDD